MFSWFAIFIQRLFKAFRVCTRTSGSGSARQPAMMGIPSNSRMRFWKSWKERVANKLCKHDKCDFHYQHIHQFARTHERQTWLTVKAAAFPSVSRIWHLSGVVVLVWRHDSNIFRCLGSSVPADPWTIFSKTHNTNIQQKKSTEVQFGITFKYNTTVFWQFETKSVSIFTYI